MSVGMGNPRPKPKRWFRIPRGREGDGKTRMRFLQVTGKKEISVRIRERGLEGLEVVDQKFIYDHGPPPLPNGRGIPETG